MTSEEEWGTRRRRTYGGDVGTGSEESMSSDFFPTLAIWVIASTGIQHQNET